MADFNFQNATFGYMMGVDFPGIPYPDGAGILLGDVIPQVNSLGIIRSGDILALNEREVVMDTTGAERVVSYELLFEAEILSDLIESEVMDALHGKSVKIVGTSLSPAQEEERFGASWSGGLVGDINELTPFLVTAPMVLRVQEPKTFGSGNVAAYRVTGKAYAGSKAQLLKRHKM